MAEFSQADTDVHSPKGRYEDRTPELDNAARALRQAFDAEDIADLYEQVNNYGEGDAGRTLAATLRLALDPACARCQLPLSGLGWCQPCNAGTPAPPYVAVDRETAYGRTIRSQRSYRVF